MTFKKGDKVVYKDQNKYGKDIMTVKDYGYYSDLYKRLDVNYGLVVTYMEGGFDRADDVYKLTKLDKLLYE